jgi:hypothetical protein
MLSNFTQIIVNLVAGAFLSLFFFLQILALMITNPPTPGDTRRAKEKDLAPHEPQLSTVNASEPRKVSLWWLAAYSALYVFIAVLALTVYLSPVEIRWWYFLGSFAGYTMVIFAPILLWVEVRQRERYQLPSNHSGRESRDKERY